MTEPADHPSDSETSDLDKKPDAGTESSKAEAAEGASDGKAGTALATAGASPVNPFLHSAAEHAAAPDAAPPPRSFASRMLDYSAHAAIIVGLIGFAWSVGDHVVNRPVASLKGETAPLAAATTPSAQPATSPVIEAKPAPKRDELAELRQSNQKMHDEIRALRSSVESLRNVVRRDTTPEQVRVLSAGLDGMKGNIGAMRSETSAAIAQLNTKVDKLQPGKVRELTERVGRLEHSSTDTTATASIPHAEPERTAKAAPKPPAKPTSLASAPEAHAAVSSEDKPQPIAGWTVRDVYQGVALVENKRGGTMEVVPGVTIPGAGVVKSIDRHGSGWTVTTSKGQFASAAAAPAPQHQAPRNAYGRGYGYDYGYGPGPYRYGY